jgi:hypothetical protein
MKGEALAAERQKYLPAKNQPEILLNLYDTYIYNDIHIHPLTSLAAAPHL